MSFVFHSHPELKDTHALISPSRHILKPGYTKEQFDNYIRSSYARSIGTSIHALVADLIDARIKITPKEAIKHIQLQLHRDGIPRNVFDASEFSQTVSDYVKDGIGFDLKTEQPLKYSDKAYGTADGIRFNEKRGELIIHDLKTGKVQADMSQLVAYAALFCLEYHIKPKDIQIILRIYQNGMISELEPKVSDILPVIDQIIELSKYCVTNYSEV